MMRSAHCSSLALRVLTFPGTRALLAFVFLYALLIQYGRSHFYRDPGSVFYDEARAFTRGYSEFREQEARMFIRSAAGKGNGNGTVEVELVKAGQKPSICASFSTVKREGVQYIENSVASTLAGLTPMERQDIHLSVFFAITNPKVHPTWSEPWLRRVVDKVHTYKVALWQLERLKRLEWSGNYEEKGVYDYTYALQHCHDTGAPWIVMFEGDVIVADGWVVKTMQGIRAIERKMRKSTKDWMYMRLFNQERSTGWSSKHIGGNNEHWIAVGIGASLVILAFAAKRRSQAVKQHLDNWTLAVVCVVAVPALVILFFQAGKASMLPPSPGVFEQGYGCCSQAMVFPRGQVPGLIQFLQKKKRGQVDLLINDYVNDEKLSRFSLYPVQVQHVGTESIRGTRKDEAQAVWSMAFEQLDPRRLKKEHAALIEVLYKNNDTQQ